jgi:transcriptional regulator with XRE-family HTH domain
MERLYLDLRGLMTAQDVTIKQLARGVGVSATHINDILAGRTYPKTDLCYDILRYLNADTESISLYFPPNGKRAEAALKKATSPREPRIVRIGRCSA